MREVFLLTDSHNCSICHLQNLTKADFGYYECVAVNKFKTTKTSFELVGKCEGGKSCCFHCFTLAFQTEIYPATKKLSNDEASNSKTYEHQSKQNSEPNLTTRKTPKNFSLSLEDIEYELSKSQVRKSGV